MSNSQWLKKTIVYEKHVKKGRDTNTLWTRKKGATEGWISYQTHTHFPNQFKNIRHITIISEWRKGPRIVSMGWLIFRR